MNKMAESGAEGELPQRRLVVKEQKNGEVTGKNKVHLIHRSNPCLHILFLIVLSVLNYLLK